MIWQPEREGEYMLKNISHIIPQYTHSHLIWSFQQGREPNQASLLPCSDTKQVTTVLKGVEPTTSEGNCTIKR